MNIDTKFVRRIETSCERMITRSETQLPKLLERKNWKALSGVTKGMCRDTLLLAMIRARYYKDAETSQSLLKKAKSYSEIMLSIPVSLVAASEFDVPIFCSLLSKDIESARKLSKLALASLVTPGSYFDIHTCILSSLILEDKVSFYKWMSEFGELPTLYWWEKQSIYFEMYSALINGDEKGFANALDESKGMYCKRAHDKEFGNMLAEYGGLEYNSITFDFMAAGLSIFAENRGWYFANNANSS